jgi:hypothetical protein
VRGIDGGASNNNLIYNNTIDATRATGRIDLISLGDNTAIKGTKINNNVLKGNYNIIDWYGGANETDIYCNDITHSGNSGYAINIGDRTPSATTISNNQISTNRTDGKLVYTTVNSSGVYICSSEINSSDIAGGGNVSIGSEPCPNSPCAGGKGSDGEIEINEEVQPPKNLHIVQ